MRDRPEVIVEGEIEGTVNEKIFFTGKARSNCSEIEKFMWDFDSDGVWDFVSRQNGRALFSYSSPATYFARFMVVDARGDTASQLTHVKITPDRG